MQGYLADIEPLTTKTPTSGACPIPDNTGDTPLRLYTIYGPPNHIDALVQAKKAEAEASHEVFDGRTTE